MKDSPAYIVAAGFVAAAIIVSSTWVGIALIRHLPATMELYSIAPPPNH